jgi:radical SAM protein with 4Fe4S-binding SPASM domain
MEPVDLQKRLYTTKSRLENNGDLKILIDTDNANWIVLNEFGARVMSGINGRTYDEYFSEISEGSENKDRFDKKLKKFLLKCGKRGFLSNVEAVEKKYEGRKNQLGIKSLHEMWIITNFSCNLRCKHCYTISRVNGEKDMLRAEEIKKIVDDARELGTQIFYFTGGEPLLRKDILDLVAYVTERSKLILFTNGTLITKEIAKELSKHKDRLIVQISIEGHNEEFNSMIRNKGMFARAVKGVERLLEEELLGKMNINGNYVRYHHLIFLICFGNALKYSFTTLTSDELSGVYDKCCAVKKELKKKKINKSLKITNEKIFDAYATNGPKKDLCGAGYTILAVDNKGSLYPCASTISEEKYSAGSMVDDEGRYMTGRLKELWESSRTLEEVRGFSIKRRDGEPGDDFRFFHGGGCWYNMKDPNGAFSKEHFFAKTYEEKTLEAIKRAAAEDIDEEDITNKYPRLIGYMSRERISCAGMRKTLDKSEDGLDLGYCICFT